MDDNFILVAVLITVAAGGLMYVFIYPHLSGDARAEKRTALITGSRREGSSSMRSVDPAKRRKAIADSLKEIEDVTKKKRVTIEKRLGQAGLDWTRVQYLMLSGGLGVAVAALMFVVNGSIWAVLAGGVVGMWGLPTWLLQFLATRRTTKFVEAFPGAIDVIVRGIRAGLPVTDCFRVVAAEAPEPVRSEFKGVVEAQTLGLSLGEAAERLAERIPIPEVSFFSIVVNITQKTGGNLSDTLSNLASVLRDRKKMREKIQAISSEAKTSAGIIGALPFLVGGAVYFIQPDYIMVLVRTFAGNIVIGVGLIWMTIGILIMRKMINFDF